MEEILKSMHAKLIVHEAIIAQTLIALSKASPQSTEFIRSVMQPVDNLLIQSQRDAPEEHREAAAMARQYFKDISFALAGKLPHHGKH